MFRVGDEWFMRLLVTGSRDWTEDEAHYIEETLNQWHTLHHVDGTKIVVVHGDARGADKIVDRIAKERGWLTEPHPVTSAQWAACKGAGMRRNREMVALGADYCIAFLHRGSGNRGTVHCANMARMASIPVAERWNEPYRSYVIRRP